jgi:uncharacterized protein (TIGR03118 family)
MGGQNSARARAARGLFYLALATLVVACGGGYGGGSGTPPATVTISVTPATITLGQSATLAWNTNGSSCTASGAWSGAQGANGTQTITPTATGTETFDLVCTGGAYGDSRVVSATLTVNAPSAYFMSSLVSDGAVPAVTTDTNLVNPWGIVFAPGAPVWVANNATETSTLYDGNGSKIPLTVSLPAGLNGSADATGIVFNASTTDFVVTNGTTSAAARFLFDGEGGTILGWSPTVDGTHAFIGYDDGAGGAVYKGLAIANDGTANHLYATDFHNGKVDVFDKSFAKVAVAGGFTDSTLPAGYNPFGIQAVQIGGQTRIVVTYAKKDPNSDDEVQGAGLGLVDVFDTGGTLVTHLVPEGGALNAPWGIALAPANFGTLSNALLIGNFADGVIHGYDPATGAFVGTLADGTGAPIATPGLWGIAFGNGARNQLTTTLFFAAGIANEVDGLYGRIDLGATAPDIVAPTVSLTAPAPAATVTGTVAVTADAADNVGVTQVEFFAGTTSIGSATTAPYSINWNTTTVANGSVSLTAVAHDAGGNTTTSAAVSVTVSNAAPAVTLAQLQANIFTPICSGCHNGVGTVLPGVMNLTSAANTAAAIIDVPSIEVPTLKRVNPGDPTNSYIVQKLEGTQTSGARMPFGGPFLDQATIDQVRAWIQAGAAP